MIQLTSSDLTIDAAASDGTARRTVSGVAVPYGKAARVSDGTKVIFEPGSLPVEGKAPKLYLNHNSEQAVGKVVERVDTPEGMMFSAKISQTNMGTEALTLAQDGVIDSVSVGVNPTKYKFEDDGTMRIYAADWVELSLVTGRPAFADAVITEVAATIHQEPIQISNNPTEPVKENETMSETPVVEAAEQVIPTSPVVFAEAKREYKMPSASEYLAAFHTGGEVWNKVNAAYKAAAKSQQTAIQAASDQDLTTDTPGLLPVPVLGPVFLNYNFIRPVVSAFGTRAMPQGNGISFTRPVISQHTDAGVQSPQGSQVTSQKMVLDANTVTRQTVAGSVFISQQTLDFTDPNAMSVILNDLAGQYMKQTDTLAAAAIASEATASGSTWTITPGNPSSLIEAIYACAYNISKDTNLFPTHMVVSVDIWKALGQQVDDVNRPVFPAIGAPGLLGMNTLGAGDATRWSGMNPLGLELVVDGNLADETLLVCHAPAVELYEAQQGMRSLENPDLLGRTFSYYGYFATFMQKAVGDTTDSTFIQSVAIA